MSVPDFKYILFPINNCSSFLIYQFDLHIRVSCFIYQQDLYISDILMFFLALPFHVVTTLITLGGHLWWWVVIPCICLSVCPSVHPSTIRICIPNDEDATLILWGFQISAWNFVGDAQYHEADKMTMLCQYSCVPRSFEIFHNRLGSGLKDINYQPKIGGVMHSTMKQIAI